MNTCEWAKWQFSSFNNCHSYCNAACIVCWLILIFILYDRYPPRTRSVMWWTVANQRQIRYIYTLAGSEWHQRNSKRSDLIQRYSKSGPAMDNRLAALFYIGIIIPTIITITVFVGFLLCLYRRSLRRKVTKLSRRALPATPSSLSQRRTTIRSLEKFDKCSQHSADSAIDIGETSLDEKLGTGETILDATQLGRSNHSYENEVRSKTDISYSTLLTSEHTHIVISYYQVS